MDVHPAHCKSAAQFHPVLVAFATCPDVQLNLAILVIFIHVVLYRFHKEVHEVIVHVYATYQLFQLFIPESIINPVTALLPLTYKVNILFPLLKFIPVIELV